MLGAIGLAHPDIQLELQSSQDGVNNSIDDKNDLAPALLIPAAELLTELEDRWRSKRSTPTASQNIPGAQVNPPGVNPTPDRNTLNEMIRLWQGNKTG